MPASSATAPRSAATITNARATLALREPEGGLATFVWSFRPADTPRPVDVRRGADDVAPSRWPCRRRCERKGFAFVGPTTMYALMEAVGIVDTHLLGSHRRGTAGVWPR